MKKKKKLRKSNKVAEMNEKRKQIKEGRKEERKEGKICTSMNKGMWKERKEGRRKKKEAKQRTMK